MKRYPLLIAFLALIASTAFAQQKQAAYTYYINGLRLSLYTDSTFLLDVSFWSSDCIDPTDDLHMNTQGTYVLNGEEISFAVSDYRPKFKIERRDSSYTELTDSMVFVHRRVYSERQVWLPNTLASVIPDKALFTPTAIYPYTQKKFGRFEQTPLFESQQIISRGRQIAHVTSLSEEAIRKKLFFYTAERTW